MIPAVNALKSNYEEALSKRSDNAGMITMYFSGVSAWEILKTIPFPIVAGMTVGGAIGRIFGPDEAKNEFTMLGAALGTNIGLLYGVRTHYERFNQWKKIYAETLVYIEFMKLHVDSAELEDFLDPITYELILDPVRSPTGRVYQKDSILRVCDEMGIIKDPFAAGEFHKSKLEPAPEFLARLRKTYMVLLQQELENATLLPQIREAIEALVLDVREQLVNFIRKNKHDLLSDSLMENAMSVKNLRAALLTLEEIEAALNENT